MRIYIVTCIALHYITHTYIYTHMYMKVFIQHGLEWSGGRVLDFKALRNTMCFGITLWRFDQTTFVLVQVVGSSRVEIRFGVLGEDVFKTIFDLVQVWFIL